MSTQNWYHDFLAKLQEMTNFSEEIWDSIRDQMMLAGYSYVVFLFLRDSVIPVKEKQLISDLCSSI